VTTDHIAKSTVGFSLSGPDLISTVVSTRENPRLPLLALRLFLFTPSTAAKQGVADAGFRGFQIFHIVISEIIMPFLIERPMQIF